MSTSDRPQLILSVIKSYKSKKSLLDKYITIEIITEAWLDSASDSLLRKHAIDLVSKLDTNAAEFATGKRVALPEELAEMKQALTCLVVLNDDVHAHALISKMVEAVSVWAVQEDVAETAIIIPILTRIPLANLRGLVRRLRI